MIKDIKLVFLKKIKSITFTNDEDKIPNNKGGQNLNGDIIIEIPNFNHGLRSMICHEILHSYIEAGEYEEEIVVYLNRRWQPCYPDLFGNPIQEDCSIKLLEEDSI